MADPVRVFISYSSKDADLVERLKTALTQAGVDVWLDHEQLTPGTPDWRAAVVKGIEQATTVIYAASPDAASSKYVGHELAIAEGEGKTILPLWIRGDKWYFCAPMGFYFTQHIDGRDDAYASSLVKLLATLGVTGTASNAPAVTLPQQTPIVAVPQEANEAQSNMRVMDYYAPNITPIGARFGAMQKDKRLMPSTMHRITVQNAGQWAASRIYAVLFPSLVYFNDNGLSETLPLGHSLGQTYWHGSIGLGLRYGEDCEIILDETHGPLRGNLLLAPQYTLYAPEQPSPAERRVGTVHFYSARLTITYRNNLDARYATAFDLDADRLAQNRDDVWCQVLSPTIIEQDLQELSAEADRSRKSRLPSWE